MSIQTSEMSGLSPTQHTAAHNLSVQALISIIINE